MSKKYKVLVNVGKNENNEVIDVVQKQGDRGQTLRIQAKAGAKYQLQEMGKDKNAAPEYVRVKRVGKNLHLIFEDGTQSDVIIEDYYDVMPEGYNGIVGETEQGIFYEYIPEDPNTMGLIPRLADGGELVSVALGGGEVVGSGAAIGVLAFNPLLAALGLAGAGVAAAAVAAGGANADAPQIVAVTDNVGNPGGATAELVSGGPTNDNTPTLSGTTTPNALVTVKDGDAVLGTTTAGPDGKWSFTPTTALGEGQHSLTASTTANGTTSTSAPFVVEVDTKPPVATLAVDPVTADNLISVQEAGLQSLPVTGKVTGGFKAGDIVTVSVNGKPFTGTVNAEGQFSINVPTADLAADPDTKLEATVALTDAAGNTGTASGVVDYNLQPGVGPNTAPVNNLPTTPQSAVGGIGKSLTGLSVSDVDGNLATVKLSVLNGVLDVSLNGATVTSGANGTATLTLSGTQAQLNAALASLTYKPNVNFVGVDNLSIVSTDAGGTPQSDADNLSITVTPATPLTSAITLNPVTGDNIISPTEGSQNTVTLTGKVTGAYSAGDVVTLNLNDKSVTGVVNAAGEFSIPVNMTDLKADADKTVQASVLAKDPVTGQTQVVGNSQTYAVETTPGTGVSLQLNTVTTDNIINKAESQSANTAVAGKVNGTVANGDIVSVQINGKTFTTAVDAQGIFSVNVPTSDLLADTDTQVNASVLSSTGQTKATAIQNYAVDTAVPVATVSVNNLTPDNLISAQEAAQATLPVTGKVTGEFRPGDVVSVSVNDKTFTAAVDAQGNFSLPVPTADLLADPDTKLQVSVLPTDASGNPGQSATAELDYAAIRVNPPETATVIFAPVAGDNIISAAEGSQLTSTLTGKVTGPFTVGDVVTVSLNDKNFTGAVNAAGEFSIPVNMTDLKADADKTVQVSVLAKDPVTGQTQVVGNSQSYAVETTPGTGVSLQLNTVTTDNIINKAESLNANTAVAGKVNGTVANGDIVSLQINSKTFTTTVDAQGNFSVNVTTSDLLADTDTQVNASVLSSTGQTKAMAIQNYAVDTAVPVATVSVNNLTPDNLISAQEAAQATLPVTGKVAGEFRPGDVVSVVVNAKTFTAAVDAQGNFSLPVPTADLLADPDTKLQVSVLPTDASGNPGQSATAELDYATSGVIPPETPTATVILNPVAGDNIISQAEGNLTTSTLTGKVTGPFTVGDVVTLNLNDKSVTGAVNAAGEFSIPVNMTDLKADADKTVQASVLAKDPVTGQAQVVGNSQSYAVEDTPGTGVSLQLNTVTADNIINKAESLNANTAVAGKVNGTVANGDIVSLQINRKTFTTTVDAQGNFSVNVPTSDLLADTDTQVNASVLSSTGQTKATAIQNYAVDTAVPVATVSVNNLTPDNLISAQEAAQGTLPVTGKVTGEFRPGDVVSVSVNDKTFTAAVDAQGNFSVPVPTTDLLADPDTKLQVSVLPTDASGNPGQSAAAVLDYATTGVIPPINAAVIFNPVAGDNIISAAEGSQPTSNLTGKVTGPFTVGDVVTVNLNDKTVTGAVNATGEFSIPVNMTDLKADADKTVQVTVLAKDPVTGQTQLVSNSQTYGVDATGNPDSALVLDPVAGDNLINAVEAASPNTAITGKVTGEFAAGDVVTVSVNNQTFTAAVNAQGQFSVSVPTTQLMQDADSKIEVSAKVTTASGLVTTTAAQDYSFDTTPPVASVSVNNITSDNLISAQEAAQATLPVTGKVTGEFRPGDVVSVSVNDKTFTAAVDAQGNFSVPVPTTDLLADPDTKLQVSVLPTDASGNPGQSATADLDYATTVVLPPETATVIFAPVAGDNIISAAEGSQLTSTLTGKVTGPFTVGDVVTVSINDKSVTGAVNAAGEFSIPVNMTDLKADADKTVQVSVLAKDPVTGQTQVASNSQTYAVENTTGTGFSLQLNAVTTDNIINKAESLNANTAVAGKVNGTVANGDIVSLQINSKTFTTTVDAQGNFSVNVPTSDLLADADTQVNASVLSSTGQTKATAIQNYAVDTAVPVATVSVNNLTPDNLISAQESAQATLPVTGKVTGEFRPGDVVSVSVNDKTFTAAVDAQGNFSLPVPTADLLADPDTKLQVSVLPTDASGNPGQSATAELDYATGVNPSTNAAVIFNPVAGDNIISAAEGSQLTSTLTGKVTGPFTVGDVVTVSLNDKSVTGAVNAAGEFSIPVNMTDLKADADKTVQVSVLAKDPVTGQTQLASNSQTYGVDASGNPDSALVLDPVTSDNLFNAVEAASLNTAITGKVTGEFASGDVVTVSVNNKTFTAAVNAQGQFSVSVPTAHLLVDADSKIEATAVATTAMGLFTAIAAQDYSFDTTPPVASISVNNITSDNLISAQEAAQATLPVTGKVTGEFRPGDVVSVNVNDKTFTAAVDAQGNFSVPVPTTDLVADPDTQLKVSVLPTDVAGNPGQSATAELDYATGVNPAITAAVIFNPVAGDNIISAAEGSQPTSTLTGKVTGPFTVGDVVTVSINNKTVTGTVTALGEFSIPVNMTDLKADADKTVQVSVLAKDPVTGQTQLISNSQTYGVDATGNPDSALVLDPVASDNLINAVEAASLNTAITGKVTGEFAAGDVVSVHVNNNTFTAAVNAQGQFSVSVPTAHLLIDADSKIEASAKVTTATGLVTTTAAQDYVVVTGNVPVTIGASDPDADGKINASGTAEPQSVVTVTWPDGTTSTTTTNPNGAWAVESPNVQPEGQVQAVALGSNGNPSQPVTAQYVDNTAPLVNITEPVVQNPNGTLTVSGTSEPGATVVVTGVNGTPVGTATVGLNGQWTLTSAKAVPEGTLMATATDINGETATDTTTYIDNTPPQVSINEPVVQNPNGTLTVSGTGEPGANVVVTGPAPGNTPLGTVTVSLNGQWTLTSPGTVPFGTLTATATDVNGEVGTDTAPYTQGLDISNLDVKDTDGDGKPTVSGQVNKPNQLVTITDPAGQTHTVAAGPDGKFSLELDPAPNPLLGTYTATAVNGADTASGSVVETDLIAPVITNFGVAETDGDGKPTVSGQTEPNLVVTITDPAGGTHTVAAGPDGKFSLELDPAPSPLLGTYSAKTIDPAGNTSLPVSVTETDLTPPVITNFGVAETDGDGKPTVSGQTEPNLVVTITDPAGGTHTVAAGPDGKFSLELDPAPSPLLGTYSAKTIDPAGNTSLPVSVTETDLTPPVITNFGVAETDGDGKPTVSGQTEPNLVVTITDPAGGTHTVAAGPDGKFSLELDPAPSPLLGTYSAKTIDPAGNTSLPVSVTETDLTPPVIINFGVAETDGDGKPTVSGQTEPNLVVTITDPAGGTHTVAAGPDGKFSLEPDPAPSPLLGTYSAKTIDPAGNTSLPVSVTETDLTAPVVTNVDVVDTDGEGKPTISGQIEPNLVVTVTDPAGNTQTVAAGPDGKFSLEIDPAPSPLTGPYTVTAVDPAGNTSAPVTVTETDLTAPVITNLDAKDTDGDGKPTVSGLVDTPNSVVTITDPSGTTHTTLAGPTGAFSLELPAAPTPLVGTYTAKAVDPAGNTSLPVSVTETDLTAPVVTGVDVVDTDGDGKPTISGQTEPNLVVIVTDPAGGTHTVTAGPTGAFSLELPTAPNPLTGPYTVTAVDPAGNTSAPVTVTETDLTAPVITNLDAKDTDGDGKPTVSGLVDTPNAVVTITDPSGTTHTTLAGPTGAFSLELPAAPTPLVGTYTATAKDAAGNTSLPVSVTETDLTAPVVTGVDVVDTDGDGKPTISGQTEPNLVVTVTDPAGGTHTVTAGPTGAFSLELPTAPNPLTGPYTVTAVDPAGNTSAPVTVTETDLTAPVITNLDANDPDADGKPTVSGLVDTPNAVVTITDPAGGTHTVAAGPTGAFSLELDPAPSQVLGTYTAKAKDAAGNVSAPVSITETDLTGPVITNLDVKDTDGDGKPTVSGLVNEPNLVVTITDPSGGTHTVAAGPDGKFSLELDPAPNPLLGTYTAITVDGSNIPSLPVSVTETDLTAPVVTGVDVVDTDGDGKPTISGQTEPNLVVTITDPAGGTHTVAAGPTGAFSLELPTAPNPLTGPYTVTAVDPAGNTSAPVTVTETDLTAPVITNLDAKDTDGDGKPTVSGLVDTPNSVVTITDPSGTTHTTLAGPTGAFSLELPAAPTPLVGTYTAKAVDPAGNTSLPVSVTETDLTAPVVTGVDVVDTDGDGKPTISGQTEPNLVVIVTDPAGGTHTVTAGPTGAFSLELPTAPNPLTGPYTVTAVDPAGNTSAPVTVTETDLTAPVITNLDAKDTDGDGKPTVSGMVDTPNSVVTITDPSGTTHTTLAGPTGAFSLELPAAPTPLVGTYTAKAVDPAGNTSLPVSVTETDLTAPVVTGVDVVDTDGDGKPTISGQTEPNLVVTITDPAGGTHTVAAGPTGAFSLELPTAPNPLTGPYTVTAVDPAGNTSAPVTVTETDLTAPVITNLDAKDTDGDGKPTVSGLVDTPNSVVTITDPSGTTHTTLAGSTGAFSLELPAAPTPLVGTYTATAKDAAGNTSLPVSVTETDLTAPVVTGVDVVDTDGDGKPTISGQTEPNLVVTVTDPAGGTHTVTAGPTGAFSLELPTAPNPLTGPYTVTAVDPAGNTSAPVTVTETDLTAPVITNLDAKDPDADGKPTVSGLVDTPNAVVTITDPAGGTHTVAAGPTGAFSLELDPAPSQVLGTYTAKAKDAAGNVSAPVSITETDLTGPVITNLDVKDTDGDGKPTVSGLVNEPNLVVTITDPSGGTHTVAAGPDGKFSLELDPAPNPLLGTYTAITVDGSNIPSLLVSKTATDLTAPVVTGVDVKDTDGDGKPTVTGQVDEPNALVTVKDPAGNTHTVAAGPDGKFSLELDPAPSPLTGPYTVTAVDPAGNTSAPVTVTETDLTAPVVTNVDVVDTDGDGKPTVSGQTEPNLVVTVKDPAGNTHTVAAGPDGKFSLEIDPAPSPLTGPYTVTAVDPAGNTSAPVTVTETDLTAPVITNLDAKDTDGDGKPTVSGLVDTPNSVVTITDPSGTTHTTLAGPTGAFSLELPAAPTPLVGTYTAKAVDPAGNTSLPVSVTETDLTAPVVTGVDVVDTDGDGKPTITGQVDEPNLVVTVTDPAGNTHTVAAGPDGKFSLEIDPAPIPLTGPYTVTAVDPAGNTSAPVTVTETDLTAPVITNFDAKDTDGDGKPTVSGLVDTPNSVVTITDPSGTTHTTLAGPTGAFSLELPAAPTPLVGTYTAKAVDPAGNTSLPVSVTETDLTAPVVTGVGVGDPDGDGKPTVSGQVGEPNLVVTIVDPTGGTHTTVSGPDGAFTIEIDPAPSPSTGTYTVTTVDPGGNTSAPVTGQLGAATPVLIDEPVEQNPDGTITVTGTGEKDAQIEVRDVNNNLVGTTTVLANGTWTLDSAGQVPQGQLTAKSTNLNQQITTDTAPYNNTPLAVLDEALGTEDSISLAGNVGTNDTNKDGSETYELTSLATGTHGNLTFEATGAWTYTRTATLDPIQTAAVDTFTYKITDASGKQSTAQLKITLDPVNDAPTVSYTTVQFATYFENAEPVVARGAKVSGGVELAPVLLNDVDSANLSGATVRVGNFSGANAFMPGDVLTFELPANSPISGVYNSTNGILTFTGTATVAQYQDALSSVKYSHTKDDYAIDGNRKIFWSVTDDKGLVNPGNLPFSWVVVKRLNDAPVLPDANLVLPNIEPLNTLDLPTDVNKYALGISINNLVTGVTDADLLTSSGQPVPKGVAIIGYNKDMGTLYLSADGGETWATPSFDVSSSSAILLRGQTNRRVYFQPHVGVEGTIADALTIRAWDASNNVVESVNGLQVTGYNITTVGGTSPYSSTTDTVSLTVATLASSPAYKGTAGDDIINASVGPDVILANGGIDQINADEGNDKVVINESNVQSLPLSNATNLDGGTGVNTLKLTVANMFLDLTNVTVQSKVNNFSVLDITGNGKNTLKIDLSSVQNLSGAEDNAATATVDESKMLVIQADQGDAVVLDNTLSWAALSGLTGDSLATLYGAEYGFIASHKYTQLSKNGATLFVDELAPVADIVGTSGNDALAGTASAEVLFGNGGVDQIIAAAGNDTVILDGTGVAALAATNTASVDGGEGVNVLKITGVNVQMDLTDTTVAGKVQNFSVLDLRVGNGNKVKLSLQQVLDLSADVPNNAATATVDESKMLVVHGTNQNTVQLVDSVNWSAVTNLGGTTLQNDFGAQFGFEPGRSYTQYTNAAGSATLFVDQLLNVDQL